MLIWSYCVYILIFKNDERYVCKIYFRKFSALENQCATLKIPLLSKLMMCVVIWRRETFADKSQNNITFFHYTYYIIYKIPCVFLSFYESLHVQIIKIKQNPKNDDYLLAKRYCVAKKVNAKTFISFSNIIMREKSIIFSLKLEFLFLKKWTKDVFCVSLSLLSLLES